MDRPQSGWAEAGECGSAFACHATCDLATTRA